MLELKQLHIAVDDKQIIAPFSFRFHEGCITAILWHNGSGKSSLAATIMGHPRYTVIGWDIFFDGESISNLPTDARAQRGIFLSFQNVPEIPGIRLLEYLRSIYISHFEIVNPDIKPPTPFVFRRMVEKMLPAVWLDVSFLDRDLYVGFSGGEKRRIEMLQVELLNPRLIILDEIDSGLDIEAIDLLRQKIDSWRSLSKTIIIITHNFHLLDSINADMVMIMGSWQYIIHGDQTLIETIRTEGFDSFTTQAWSKK